jgi:hypothetical protein
MELMGKKIGYICLLANRKIFMPSGEGISGTLDEFWSQICKLVNLQNLKIGQEEELLERSGSQVPGGERLEKLLMLNLLWMLKSSAKSRLALSWIGEFGVFAELQDWLTVVSAVDVVIANQHLLLEFLWRH